MHKLGLSGKFLRIFFIREGGISGNRDTRLPDFTISRLPVPHQKIAPIHTVEAVFRENLIKNKQKTSSFFTQLSLYLYSEPQNYVWRLRN